MSIKDKTLTIEEIENAIQKLAGQIREADITDQPRSKLLSELVLINIYYGTYYAGVGTKLNSTRLFYAVRDLMKMHGLKPLTQLEYLHAIEYLKTHGLIGQM